MMLIRGGDMMWYLHAVCVDFVMLAPTAGHVIVSRHVFHAAMPTARLWGCFALVMSCSVAHVSQNITKHSVSVAHYNMCGSQILGGELLDIVWPLLQYS